MRYKPKTKMWRHQKRALKKIVRNRGGALFMPMRSGKTKVALDFCQVAAIAWGVERVVVVAPLSALGVWRAQIRLHVREDSELTFLLVNYERLYRRVTVWEVKSNGERTRTWEPEDHHLIEAFLSSAKSVMICDESHRLAKPTSLQSKKAWRLGQLAFMRLILTGTPWHRKPIGIFGQFRFLDVSVFGDSFRAFKRMYVYMGGYMGMQPLKYLNQHILRAKVKENAFVMKVIPMSPPIEEVVPVQLSRKAVDAYRQMAEESILELQQSDAVATIPLVRALRLAQISGGWIKDEEGETHRIHSDLRKSLYDWLGDRLEEGQTKIVIYARFIPELRDVAEVSKGVGYSVLLLHGGVSGDERERRIAEFDETDDPTVFVVQVQTGSEGIDLSASSVAVYYSLPTSLVQFDQSKARIRKFKDKRTRAYYYFLPQLEEGTPTVTGITLLSLKAGKDLAETMDEDPYMVFEAAL